MKISLTLANAEREPEDSPAPYIENSYQSKELPPLCTACGKHHGSVTGEAQCLRMEIIRLRHNLRSMNAMLSSYSKAVKSRNEVLARDRRSMEGVTEEVAALRALREAMSRI